MVRKGRGLGRQLSAYDDSQLERFLSDLESDLVERKESLKGDAGTKIREALCAFANDLPAHRRPGVVIVGARDDGTSAHLQITDELLLALADMKTDGNILPPPTIEVQKRRLGGSEYAVVTVWPSDSPPVRYKGRIWIRLGPRRAVASGQDERILNERRRHRDQPFDVRPMVSSSLADIDLRRFEEEYLSAAVARDILDANDRTVEQRLAATKMIVSADEPIPTVLGILVLSPRAQDFIPGAYLQFLRLNGPGLDDGIVDEQRIDGPIPESLRRIDEKLLAHNTTAVDLSTTPEKRTALYPMLALQQIVRNAVMHRTYESTNAPTRITWYSDRIEVISPGGPFGSVTADNFGDPGVADYRNPNLAEALKVLGFVQRFGVGIAQARRALRENGNPPLEFQVRDSHVGVILRSQS